MTKDDFEQRLEDLCMSDLSGSVKAFFLAYYCGLAIQHMVHSGEISSEDLCKTVSDMIRVVMHKAVSEFLVEESE